MIGRSKPFSRRTLWSLLTPTINRSQRSGLLQIGHMAHVQQVKAAVGKDDSSVLAAELLGQLGGLLARDQLSTTLGSCRSRRELD